MTNLESTLSIVTGAAGGIGAAVAARLTHLGSRVIGVDVDDRVTQDPTLQTVVGDITDPDVQQECLALARATPGDLSILVNCAFAEERATLLDGTAEGWERTIAVSLLAPVQLSRRFVLELDSRPGAIVNVASVHALRAAAGFGSYSAAKAGLVAFTRTAALEWGPLEVRVNAVAPGFVAVERNAHLWGDPAALERIVAGVPLGRAGQPEDVARCVAFLAGPDAAFVTGAVLPVDGGTLARLTEGGQA